jgi:uncharacterized membrane protein YhhN
MGTPYAPRWVVLGWAAGGWAGAAYGVFLTVTALRSPPGAELTGHWIAQPAFKASMALLLAIAAVGHPIAREWHWLMPALVFSATGDWLLAIPWLPSSFVLGLTAFLLAHLCFLGALVPLAQRSVPRLVAAGVICPAYAALLVWFWPHLGREAIPVTAYIVVLAAMVSAAMLARLPTIWTAVGAACFAVSDAMIGIGRFVLDNEALAVSIWWMYAAAQILITAGFFFGRPGSATGPGEG